MVGIRSTAAVAAARPLRRPCRWPRRIVCNWFEAAATRYPASRSAPGSGDCDQFGAVFPGGVDGIDQRPEQLQPFLRILELGDVNFFRVQGNEPRLAAEGERQRAGVVGDDPRPITVSDPDRSVASRQP